MNGSSSGSGGGGSGGRSIVRRLLRNPVVALLVGVVLALPAMSLAEIVLPNTFSPNTRISSQQVNANFAALNAGKVDSNKVIAFIHTHTQAIVDCNNDACSRLPAVVQGIEDLAITATPISVSGAPGGGAELLTQPVYVRKFAVNGQAYYELIYGDGGRPFPVGLKVSVIAVRP
jgi:hypothetical protein